jgi:fructokinase
VIVVAGEALVDLVPDDGALLPLLGGSPFNVAVALGRLEVSCAYLGRCSTDGLGRALRDRLADEGVDLRLVEVTDDPTTLALVEVDARGHATYGFYLTDTSAAGLRAAALPELPAEAALHVSLGAVTLATRPAGQALGTLLAREQGRRLVSLDPNVRPAVLDDPAAYAGLVDEAVTRCDLVKVSDEDLAQLHPDREPLEVARSWVAAGPVLVVVTQGAQGATGITAAGEATVPPERVAVVDTVGAGDAFTAGLLAALEERGRLIGRAALAELGLEELRAVLARAGRVAAVTCTRPGADPPRAAQL